MKIIEFAYDNQVRIFITDTLFVKIKRRNQQFKILTASEEIRGNRWKSRSTSYFFLYKILT